MRKGPSSVIPLKDIYSSLIDNSNRALWSGDSILKVFFAMLCVRGLEKLKIFLIHKEKKDFYGILSILSEETPHGHPRPLVLFCVSSLTCFKTWACGMMSFG
jgi:hypothetical protein